MPETPITIQGKQHALPAPAIPRQVARTFCLFIGKQAIPLEPGIVTLGRSSKCDVILEDVEVSRNHARLIVSPIGIILEDIASCNGVYVNGERIRSSHAIEEGDRLTIGGVELTIKATYRISSAMRPAVRPASPPPERLETPAPTTRPGHRTDAFNELARLSERMLTMGRPEVAIKLVSERLQALLDALREGDEVSIRMLESATTQALRLAAANNMPKYVDLALELNLLAKRVMNDEAVDLLERALDKVSGFDSANLFFYQQMLHSERDALGPFDRIRSDRILGLRSKE